MIVTEDIRAKKFYFVFNIFNLVFNAVLLAAAYYVNSGVLLLKETLVSLAIANFAFYSSMGFIKWGLNKEQKKFLASFFGSILYKMVFVTAAIVILLNILNLAEKIFIIEIFIFYFFYLSIEIAYLAKINSGNRTKK